MNDYTDLIARFEDGAMIFGIEEDGRMHRILDPQWTCPPDRYIALVPHEFPYE